MKSFIAFILSFSMMWLQVSEAALFINDAQAQEKTPEEKCDQYHPSHYQGEEKQQAQEKYSSCLQQVRNEQQKEEDAITNQAANTSESDTGTDGAYNNKHGRTNTGIRNALNLMLTLAIAFVGSTLIAACNKLSFSMKLFIGACLYYLFGEIMYLIKQKKDKEPKVDEYADDRTQAEAFEKAAQLKDDAAAAEKSRSQTQMVSGGIMLAAAALAGVEAIAVKVAYTVCQSYVPNYTDAAQCASAKGVAAADETQQNAPFSTLTCNVASDQGKMVTKSLCPGCISEAKTRSLSKVCCVPAKVAKNILQPNKSPFSLFASQSLIAKSQGAEFFAPNRFGKDIYSVMNTDSNVDALFQYDQWRRLAKGETSSSSIEDYQNLEKNYAFLRKSENQFKLNLTGLMNKVGSFLFPQAHAIDIVSALGIGGGLIAAYAVISIGAQQWMYKVIGTPMKRLIMFGAAGALTMAAGAISKSASEKMEEEAKELRERAAQLRGVDNPSTIAQEKGKDMDGPTAIEPTTYRPGNYADTGTQAQSCIGQASRTNPSGYDPQCECLKNNTCVQLDSTIPSDRELGFQVPAALRTTATAGLATANSANRGDLEGARLNAEKVQKNAAKIAKINENIENKLNDLAKKAGEKPLNFKKARQNFITGLSRKVSGSLEKKGLLGALGTSRQASTVAKASAIREDKSKKPVSVTRDSKKGGLPGAIGSGGSLFGDLDDGEVAKAGQDEIDFNSDQLKDLDIGGTEINGNEDSSIFDILSNRYMRVLPRLIKK